VSASDLAVRILWEGRTGLLDETLPLQRGPVPCDAPQARPRGAIRITPSSADDLKVRELGIFSPDVRRGTNRFDDHAGLQAAFVEVKLADLQPYYISFSVRAGIQEFQWRLSRFLVCGRRARTPRVWQSKIRSVEYNLAYFHFSKNTNSGLNTFDRRHQQVILGNVYSARFLFSGLHRRIHRCVEQR